MEVRKIKTWQWIVLAIALVFVVDWFIQRPDARSRELNRALESRASPQLKAYPYQFRVLRVEGDSAVMTTPRNVDVPALRALGAIYPDLNVHNPNDPDFIAAEKKLGEVQSEARSIVLAQKGIANVRWELDKAWLAAHGIEVPAR